MSWLASPQSQMKAVIAAVIALIVAGGAGAYMVMIQAPDNAGPEPAPAAQEQAAPEPAAPDAATAGASSQAPGQPTPQPAAQAAVPAPPAFEVIRIEPSGEGVFAGSAEPGATVRLLAGGDAIAEAVADASGAWAMVIDKPLPPGASDLWLSVDGGGAEPVRSLDMLAVVIEEDGGTPLAVLSRQSGPSKVVQKPDGADATAAADAPVQVASTGAESAGAKDEAGDQAARAQPPARDAAHEADEGPDEAPGEAPAPIAAAGATEQADGPVADGKDVADGQEAAGSEIAAVPAARPDSQADAPAAAPGGPVAIDAADYGEDRRLHISGSAAPGAAMRIYYDNRHLGDTAADADGRWALSAPRDLDGGVHAIRADHVDQADGDVLARAEVSFIAQLPDAAPAEPGPEAVRVAAAPDAGTEKRGAEEGDAEDRTPGAPDAAIDAAEDGAGGTAPGEAAAESASAASTASAPAQPAPAQPASAQPASNRIVVRRGDSLWRISRAHYGRGVRYTVIYEANRDQIRNPHLIYPDQVFLVPRALGEEAASR